jgi:RNA polymerase sigma-70 factor, ECF subfamily
MRQYALTSIGVSVSLGKKKAILIELQPSFTRMPMITVQEDKSFGRSAEASDEELVIAAQFGDQQAFVELCKRHSSATRKRIFAIVRNHEDADDILQDTLLSAYTHLAGFRRSCKFSTWITSIAVNSALMLIRKRRTRREAQPVTSCGDEYVELKEFADNSPGPEDLYAKRQTVLLVKRAVRTLRPNLRSVVDHYYGSEESLEESARALELTVASAKSRLMRGRLRLRSTLRRYGLSSFGS